MATQPSSTRLGQGRARFGVVVVAAAAVLWPLLNGSEDHPLPGGAVAPPAAAISVLTSLEPLRVLPAVAGHRVYWAGDLGRRRLQLTEAPDGSIGISYPARRSHPSEPVLAVRSRPSFGAFGAIEEMARNPRAIVRSLSGGGLAVVDPSRPRQVSFGYPGSSVRGEVEGLSAKALLQLITTGRVRPIGGTNSP